MPLQAPVPVAVDEPESVSVMLTLTLFTLQVPETENEVLLELLIKELVVGTEITSVVLLEREGVEEGEGVVSGEVLINPGA